MGNQIHAQPYRYTSKYREPDVYSVLGTHLFLVQETRHMHNLIDTPALSENQLHSDYRSTSRYKESDVYLVLWTTTDTSFHICKYREPDTYSTS